MELVQLSFLVILLVSSPPENFVDNVLLSIKINIILMNGLHELLAGHGEIPVNTSSSFSF